jgi:hypothetical protein
MSYAQWGNSYIFFLNLDITFNLVLGFYSDLVELERCIFSVYV